MASKVVKLNESELKNLIRESVVRFLNENIDEIGDTKKGQYKLGRLAVKKYFDTPSDKRFFTSKPGTYHTKVDKDIDKFASDAMDDTGEKLLNRFDRPKGLLKAYTKGIEHEWNKRTSNLEENTDELSPGFAMHAAHAAAEDKKKHTGRGKNSPDPAIRAKRDAQIKKFGDYAANGINQDIDDPDLLAIGDRAARRMMYAKGPYSAYLTNDIDDIDSVKLYNDDYAEGDEPMAIGDLPDDEREKIHRGFDKFKAHHAHAKELDDKYLEEAVKRAVRNALNENKLWDAILNDMKEFANSGKDVYDFIEFATKKYGIDEERFYTSGGYEDWCRLTGEDPSSYQI